MNERTPTAQALDYQLIRREWQPPSDGSVYLNTGSCGRKPASVLQAVRDGSEQLNNNPTRVTFFSDEWWQEARVSIAAVLGVEADSVLLTQNTTQGLHLVLNSFLRHAGDEFVTTTHEHGSLRTIARHLSETRGITVRQHATEPLAGSGELCRGLLALVTDKTRLVAVSEIDCLSGWRPDLSRLAGELASRNIPLLVDGAHAPGQGPCRAGDYPLWVGSGHKWLCAPNGTGMVHVRRQWLEHLQPVWLGDRYYNEFSNPLLRFEFPGTCDVVRWLGLAAAGRLALLLGQEKIAARQRELTDYLRKRMQTLPATVTRTPDVDGERSGMVVFTWAAKQLRVNHLRDWLWEQHQIWTQPDFCYGEPGHGLRISCHISNTEGEIDQLVEALAGAFV